jgi:hypothetical protein
MDLEIAHVLIYGLNFMIDRTENTTNKVFSGRDN